MKQTKIDWCDCTLNPVVGCPNGCQYCYARKLNDRFHFVENWNEPQFFPERLKQLEEKKSKSIFMDSMSDIGRWKPEWVEQTVKAMLENPQHRYIFLSKVPNAYDNFYNTLITTPFDDDKNHYIYGGYSMTYSGYSITMQKDLERIDHNTDFISIDPILEPITLLSNCTILKQIIIGAETGNRVGKVIPKKEWVDSLVKQADEQGIRVFMKSSLKEIMGADFRQDKLIWDKE